MKETLEDSEIAHPLNEGLLKEAEDIKGERKLVKDRLDKLEETRTSVSESVYQKVRADYAGKMNRTTERLIALKKDLEGEEQKLMEKKGLVESHLKLHAEKIEEATLRHALGEFAADEHRTIRTREEKEIRRLETALKKLEEGLVRHRGIFEGEEIAPDAGYPPQAGGGGSTRSARSAEGAPPVISVKAEKKEERRTAPEHTPAPTLREPSAPKPFASLSNPAIDSTAKIRIETGTVTAAQAAPALRKTSELAVLENGKVIQTVVLDHNILIGRSPSNDVVLKEPKVSRKHAEIQFVGGKYVLLDLESSNGTFVAGKKIAEYTLQPNDEITIGNTKMVFKG